MQGSDNNNRLDRLVYLVNHLRHYQKLADFDKKALRMSKKYEAMVDEFLSEQRVMELPFNDEIKKLNQKVDRLNSANYRNHDISWFDRLMGLDESNIP